MFNSRRFVAICALLVFASYVAAAPVAITSYTINTPTEASYPDDTGNQLTDGLFGSATIASSGDQFPWVGWSGVSSMSMTFNTASQPIDSISIDFLNSTGIFTILPDSVDINGQTFNLTQSDIPNGTRGTLAFNLSPSIASQTLSVTFSSALAGSGFHVLIDEVSVTGPVTTPSGAPEPAPVALLAAGIGGIFVMKRRR